MTFRRAVTGIDEQGKAVFVDDSEVELITGDAIPGAELVYVWGSDEVPTAPNAGALPGFVGHWPQPGGLRFSLYRMPAAGHTTDVDSRSPAALAEAEQKFPGLVQSFDPDHPGMHTSPTVDLGFVLEGTVTLELDDGVTKTFTKGDLIIQNGTAHKWSNPTEETTWMGFVLIGAHAAPPVENSVG